MNNGWLAAESAVKLGYYRLLSEFIALLNTPIPNGFVIGAISYQNEDKTKQLIRKVFFHRLHFFTFFIFHAGRLL